MFVLMFAATFSFSTENCTFLFLLSVCMRKCNFLVVSALVLHRPVMYVYLFCFPTDPVWCSVAHSVKMHFVCCFFFDDCMYVVILHFYQCDGM